MKPIWLASILLLLSVCRAAAQAPETAQDPAGAAGDAPIEISADNALEWDRNNRRYLARGHAIAKQKEFQVEADLLTADYSEKPDGGTEITRLTAEGHVVLTNGDARAYGDRAVYQVLDGKAVMTGGDLRAGNAETLLTAKENFEYYATEGRIVANGAPVITQGDSRLTADRITAWTAKNADETENERQAQSGGIDRAEAAGNVVITTPRERATAARAVYTASKNVIELIGNVVLHQGENRLEGGRAEMNTKTKLSRMFGAQAKGGRVKGVFYPDSAKSGKS
jgi:lipopolysaccharide export system protein LptA